MQQSTIDGFFPTTGRRSFSTHMNLNIRSMTGDDSARVAEFLPDLGYAVTPEILTQRLRRLLEWPDQMACVVEIEGFVVGLCQVQGVRLLASDGYAEMQALVVAANYQGQGLGKALLKHAIDWSVRAGYLRLRLRSGLHRAEAHQFYVAQGFTQSKASYAFELCTEYAED
ncbi:MAG: GNAT family N-acetyltransferase [Rhodoferax sp.]|nr:GNAT family N-acetyltransferase [Rhodoferax sp.]